MPNRKRFPRFALILTLLLALCAGTFSTRAEQTVEAKPNQLQATDVVISEVRFHGSAGANDDFVELYNPTTFTVNLNGWRLRTSNASGTTSNIYSFSTDVFLLPGQFYLLTNDVYNDATIPDVKYGTTSITDDGGVALIRPDNSIADQIGLSNGSAYKEGASQIALTTNVDRGYERKLGGILDSCLDDGDNLTDFQLKNPSNPQNSATPRRGCGFSSDLELTQTVSNSSPSAGGNIDFTITITNNGVDNATNVSVKDVLPAGFVYQSSVATIGTYDSGTGIWTIGNLNTGGSETLTITASVTSSGTKTNIAEVWTSDQVDPDSVAGNSINEDDYKSIQVTPLTTDLSLSQTVSTPTPAIGSNVIFTITVSNEGPNSADITVKDLLPSGLIYQSSNPSVGTYNNVTGIWSVGMLLSGSNATLDITAKVNTFGTKNNSAEIWTSNQFDVDATPGNNSTNEDDDDVISITPPKITGLVVTNNVNNSNPLVGTNVIFTIVIINPSSNLYPATNVNVSALLPAGLTYVSHSATQGTYTSGPGTWSVGAIPVNSSATLVVTAKVINNIPATFTATVTSNEYLDSNASSSLNNPLSGQAELTIDQTLVSNTGTAGHVELVISLKNTGPDTATGVSVRDLLPSGLTYVSHTTAVGTYDANTGIWSIGSVNKDATVQLRIKVKVAASGASTNNTAQVWTSNQFDSNLTDNSKSLEVPIADISLIQTADITASTAIFTITITNSGPDDAMVTVKSNLPDLTSYTHVSNSDPVNFSFLTGIWNVGLLAEGASKTLVITTNTTGVLQSHIVEIFSSNMIDPDSVPNNFIPGEDDVSGVPFADLSLIQTVDNSNPAINSSVVFTVKLTNSGYSSITGVKVRNQFPAGLAYISAIANVGSYDPATGVWTVGTLASGTSSELKLTATIANSGTFIHTVEVYESNLYDPDSVPNNGSNTEDDKASISVTTSSAVYSVVINEIAWAGTSSSLTSDEWIELYNTESFPINLTGWTLRAVDGSPSITLNGIIPAGGYFLLERGNNSTDDSTVLDIPADQIYVSNALSDSGETISLYDSSNKVIDIANSNGGSWPAGSSSTYGTMERLNISNENDSVWVTNNGVKKNGKNANGGAILGTPKQSNSPPPTPTPTRTITPTANAFRSVIINEIAWAGTASALPDDEWIELYNPTSININLTGWSLISSDGSPTIFLVGNIPAGGYFLLERDENSSISDIIADQIYIGGLSNSGESLILYDSSNKIIDTANINGGSWPAGSSSSYGTMERINISNDFDNSWKTNTGFKKNGKNANGGDIFGTPKQSNSSGGTGTPTPRRTATPTLTATFIPVVIPPRPIINEILARPGFDWNQDGATDVFDEFIEIKNLTAIDISLSGWKLDKFTSSDEPIDSFSIPEGVTLKPGERIVFYSKQTNLLLSDGGETVRLVNSSGKIYDAYTYNIARTEDKSFCRLPDGTPGNSWFEDCIPSPNLSNTREGKSPTSPDNAASPVCNLPDTIPLDFFIPECNGYGADIWNPFYWDFTNWIDKLWIQQTTEKWRTFIE